MSLPPTFQEAKMRPDFADPRTSCLGGDDASAGERRLLERLKRLRGNPDWLPNLRVCQVVGAKVCLSSCDPFRLDEAGARELAQLGLRSIVDLRSDHERAESGDAPLYSRLRVLQWQPANGGGFVRVGVHYDDSDDDDVNDDASDVSETANGSSAKPAATIVAYRVDCLQSPQPQLRRFLADYSGPCRLCVPDVSAYLLPAAGGRSTGRLLRDVLDCFPDALAAAFRVLARPGAHPVLLASLDGQQVAAVVSCLMQLLLGEDASIVADMHAASETEYGRSRGLYPPEEHSARLKASRVTMLQLIDYIVENYRSAENYLLRAGLSQQEIRQLKTV